MKCKKEDLFLKYCCQSEVDKEKVDLLLKDGLDWDYLFENAKYQRMQLLLYLYLKKSGWEDMVPKRIMDEMKKDYKINIENNLRLISELKRLLEIFRENNIKVIVLKGMVLEKILSLEMYKPICDIDILIQQDDRYKVDNLLKSEGYLYIPPRERMFWEAGYHHSDKGVIIDFHWGLFDVQEYQNITRIDMNKIWEEVMIIKFEGMEVLTLSLEDTLWSLCVHFAIHHIFCDLILLFEISEFIRRYKNQISWLKVISRAKNYRIKNGVYFTLYFAKTILNVPMPTFVLKKLRASYLRRCWLLSLVSEERFLSLPLTLKDVRDNRWALCSWIIADNIIDSIKAFCVSLQILKARIKR